MKPIYRFSHLFLKLLAIIIIAIMSSCEEALEEPYENFVLPQGKHSGSFPVQSLQNTSLRFQAIFDETAVYQTATEENQHDINKLMGFADCNAHHHENSARFGWRWLDGQLEVHAYTYTDRERKTEYIGSVELNTPYEYEIRLNDDSYDFLLEGHGIVSMKRTKYCATGLYYMLFPYFGGDEKAPHDIIIQIKALY